MRFEKIQGLERVYGGTAANVVWLSYTGSRRCDHLHIRIDGRLGAYRVDKHTLCGWEAIDGGEGFATLAEAKRWAARFVRVCRDERTLSPNLPHERASERYAAAEQQQAVAA